MKQRHVFPLDLLGLFAFIVFSSCSTEETIEQILGAHSSQAPVFLGCKAVSETEVNFQFSLPVKAVYVNFDPRIGIESVQDGAKLTVNLAETLAGGERITVDLLVEDERGNTLNVLVPFRTRNDRMPSLILTELRTENGNLEKANQKSEFVEFKTLSPGSLGALRLFLAGNTKNPLVFEFPPAEVQAGEYIILHLRGTGQGIVNETGPDLGLSGGIEAVPDVRDFWVAGSKKLIHKTDAVYFMDQDDTILDAVILSEKPDPQWSKEHFTKAAELLHKQGAWVSKAGTLPGPQDAVDTSTVKTATTRSISRNESAMDTNAAEDWFVTPIGGCTPGRRNTEAASGSK
jgi:hypothetical protein